MPPVARHARMAKSRHDETSTGADKTVVTIRVFCCPRHKKLYKQVKSTYPQRTAARPMRDSGHRGAQMPTRNVRNATGRRQLAMGNAFATTGNTLVAACDVREAKCGARIVARDGQHSRQRHVALGRPHAEVNDDMYSARLEGAGRMAGKRVTHRGEGVNVWRFFQHLPTSGGF